MTCNTPDCTGKATVTGLCWTCNQFTPNLDKTMAPDPKRVEIKRRLDEIAFERELEEIENGAN